MADAAMRDQLSSLRALLALSMVMTTGADEAEIVHMATTAVPSLGDGRAAAVRLEGAWMPAPSVLPDAEAVAAELDALGRAAGPVSHEGVGWAWAFPLFGLGTTLGHLVVEADTEPAEYETFLLSLLAQHTASALVNARLHSQERQTAARERELAEELGATNLKLERLAYDAEQAREAAQQRLDIHELLTRVAVNGAGEEEIALAVHQLTGHPVAVEDAFGTLIAWAGPGRPDPYPKPPPSERQELIGAALSDGRPVRDGSRLLALAQARGEALGVVALVDLDHVGTELDEVALEHAATVLALELAHRRSVAETELRLGGDLVDELLTARNLEGVVDRCRAIGYDLGRPHRVVVVDCPDRDVEGDALCQAVRRAARDLAVGSLLVAHGTRVDLLASGEADWSALQAAVRAEVGGAACRVGVGGRYPEPPDFARSHREALFALSVQASVGVPRQVVAFDDLGVYRLLSSSADVDSMDGFVRRWLGKLLDYDRARRADLVSTLRGYLAAGGNYENAATLLSIHRSTLRYRLNRIREISGHDLADPEIRFNLQLATHAKSTIEALRGAQ
jgi:sugar diacid utilization regulator